MANAGLWQQSAALSDAEQTARTQRSPHGADASERHESTQQSHQDARRQRDDADATTRLLIVRHGESLAMTEGFVGGPKSCRGLSERGKAQAAALRDRFASGAEAPVDAVYSSPLPRARQTTDIVLPALGLTAVDVRVDDDLEEMRLWPADGLTWDQARRQFDFVRPDEAPFRPVVPGGESRAVFRARVSDALSRIAEAHPGERVFIGSHGGIASAAMAMAMGSAPDNGGVGMTTRVTSVTEIELVRQRSRRSWIVHRFNDMAHFDALPEHLRDRPR